jgi:hypothetical protein
MSYNSGVPNSGKSIITTTTSVVSKDKHAIKSTKKVIEGELLVTLAFQQILVTALSCYQGRT